MTRKQLNRLSMFKAVQSLFNQHPTIWNTRTPLVTAFTGFQTAVNGINAQSVTQMNEADRGLTAEKNEELDKVCQQAYNILLKMRGYAKVTKNTPLITVLDIPVNKMFRVGEEKALNHCLLIHQHATEHLAALADYEVTSAEVTALGAAIEAVKPMSSQRSVAGSVRVNATGNLKELFSEASEQLDILDDLVEGMIADSNFVAQYLQLRKIIDRPATLNRDDDDDDDDTEVLSA